MMQTEFGEIESEYDESDDRTEQEQDDHFEDTYQLKPNEHYEVNGYSYDTDRYGRIKECSGSLHLGTDKRHQTHQAKAGGEDRRETDEGGHLIAYRFEGSGKVDNIVAMDAHFNKSEYKQLENKWNDALKPPRSASVDVDIRCRYPSGSQRPSEFIVRYTITEQDGSEINQVCRFKNEAKQE
ncbi:MAG: DNA/RNA non-specific endonuclease [Oscillospiraceae bacterium]|nr:DNA/RNA non-specific endonuclease [Oscillospiraceae bacterium]